MNFQRRQALNILNSYGDFIEKSKKAFIGEIREFKDGKYQKQNSGKWKRLSEKGVRGKVVEGGLTPKMELSIMYYTGSTYDRINSYLLLNSDSIKNKVDYGVKENIEDKIDVLKSALDRLPNFKGTVNRWISMYKDVDEIFNDYKSGDLIQYPAFMSTTKSDKRPEMVKGDIRFEIESLTGKDIESYSEFEEEQEVLFAPDSVFEVRSAKKLIHEMGYVYGLEIKMKQIL